jgi:hypothetical protein
MRPNDFRTRNLPPGRAPPRSMSLVGAKSFDVVGLKWLTRTASTPKARKASSCSMCGSESKVSKRTRTFSYACLASEPFPKISLQQNHATRPAECSGTRTSPATFVAPRENAWAGQCRGLCSVLNSCAASRRSSAALASCLATSSLFSFDFEPPETWTITALLKVRENSRTSPNGPVRAA